jgi:type IV pilus assembly protein PilV
MMHVKFPISQQRGGLMIEVLVTIAIIVIGLWGLMDVQGRLQKSEMESYQRTQALMLLNDMSSRIAVNRLEAAAYVTSSLTPDYLGVGMTCSVAPSPTLTPAQISQADISEWCQGLQGAAEAAGTVNVGAMVAGRGCIEELNPSEYLITVVWQGLAPVAPPPVSITCGAGLYDEPPGSPCAEQPEACRRYVSTILHVGNLLDP